jgi:hypothetical protein
MRDDVRHRQQTPKPPDVIRGTVEKQQYTVLYLDAVEIGVDAVGFGRRDPDTPNSALSQKRAHTHTHTHTHTHNHKDRTRGNARGR